MGSALCLLLALPSPGAQGVTFGCSQAEAAPLLPPVVDPCMLQARARYSCSLPGEGVLAWEGQSAPGLSPMCGDAAGIHVAQSHSSKLALGEVGAPLPSGPREPPQLWGWLSHHLTAPDCLCLL